MSAMTANQLRTLAGVPAAGEFGRKSFADGDVTLATAAHSGSMKNVTLSFDGPLDSLGLQSYNYTTNHFILAEQRDMFDLNPPYQRGSVWDVTRRQQLIRSILLGIPVGAIAMNKNLLQSPIGAVYDVIDGKQRIEALRAFADSQFPIPATWVDPEDILSTVDVDGWPVPGVLYSGLGPTFHRVFAMRPMPSVEASWKTYAEQAEIFRLINSGGVEQTEESLANAAALESSL